VPSAAVMSIATLWSPPGKAKGLNGRLKATTESQPIVRQLYIQASIGGTVLTKPLAFLMKVPSAAMLFPEIGFA